MYDTQRMEMILITYVIGIVLLVRVSYITYSRGMQ